MKFNAWVKKLFNKEENENSGKKSLGIYLQEPRSNFEELLEILATNDSDEKKDPFEEMNHNDLFFMLLNTEDEEEGLKIYERINDQLTKNQVESIMQKKSFAKVQLRLLEQYAHRYPQLIAMAERHRDQEVKAVGVEIRRAFSEVAKFLSDEELKNENKRFIVECCKNWEEEHEGNYAYCTAICSIGGCEYRHKFFATEREALEDAYVQEKCGVQVETQGACPECYQEYIQQCI